MAVSHADGTTFAGAMICPILTGVFVVAAGAGWLTVPCVVAASPVGFAILYLGRWFTYLVIDVGLRPAKPMKPWAQQIFVTPFFLLYLILPYFGITAAVCAASYAATLVAALGAHVGGWMGFAAVGLTAVISGATTVAFYRWRARLATKGRGESGSAAQQ